MDNFLTLKDLIQLSLAKDIQIILRPYGETIHLIIKDGIHFQENCHIHWEDILNCKNPNTELVRILDQIIKDLEHYKEENNS